MKKLLIITIVIFGMINSLLPMKRSQGSKNSKQAESVNYNLKKYQKLLEHKRYFEAGEEFVKHTEVLIANSKPRKAMVENWKAAYSLLVNGLQEPTLSKNMKATLALMQTYAGFIYRANQQEETATLAKDDPLIRAQKNWLKIYNALPINEQRPLKKQSEEVRLGLIKSHYNRTDFNKAIDEAAAFIKQGNFEPEHEDIMLEEAHFIIGGSHFIFDKYKEAFSHFFAAYRPNLTISPRIYNYMITLLGSTKDVEELLKLGTGILQAAGEPYLKALWLFNLGSIMEKNCPNSLKCKNFIAQNQLITAPITARLNRPRQCLYMPHDPDLIADNNALDS